MADSRRHAIVLDMLRQKMPEIKDRTIADVSSHIALGIFWHDQQVLDGRNLTALVPRDRHIAIEGEPVFLVAGNSKHCDRERLIRQLR